MTLEKLKSNIKWWESKRLIFNILVGISGIIAIYKASHLDNFYWSNQDTFGTITWGLGANIFYSCGMILELFNWYYLKEKLNLNKLRLLLFIIGLIFSCLWTYFNAWMYFAHPHFP